MTTKKKIVFGVLGVVFLLAVLLVFKGCVQRAPFDPAVIAAAETEMWKAYYVGDRGKLGRELVGVQRTQFGLTLYQSALISRHLAKAAMMFTASRSGYDRTVLPELVEAYARMRDATGLAFDPQRAAEAELSWWTARRDPRRNAPEQVGREIAALYVELYGHTNEAIEQAGLLRAQAAALRDRGGIDADWGAVEDMLTESYETLAQGIQEQE